MDKADEIAAAIDFQKPNESEEERRKHSRNSQETAQLLTTSLALLASWGKITPEDQKPWRVGLADLSEDDIRRGMRKVRDHSGWFDLSVFRGLCKPSPSDYGLPDAHSAYVEAATAKSPKDRQKYSHPAVYHAGCDTGWFDLNGQPEAVMFPKYRANYEKLIQRVIAGEQLAMPNKPALPDSVDVPSSPESTAYQEFKKQKESMGL